MNVTMEGQTLSKSTDLVAAIAVAFFVICIYCLGTCLHIKIIMISRKEKEVTWKIDIANSVVLLTYYAYSIFIHSVTHFIPDLYRYTGEWFCYASTVVLHYGLLYTIAHSMYIAMVKYCIIVHDISKVTYKDKVKETFFWINLLHPIFIILLWLIIKPDFYVEYHGFETKNICLGNPNMNKTIFFDMCSFTVPSDVHSPTYVAYIFRRILCIAQVLYVYVTATNIFDALFYTTTFYYMRR